MSCSGTTRRSDSRPNLQLEVVVDAQRSMVAELLRLVDAGGTCNLGQCVALLCQAQQTRPTTHRRRFHRSHGAGKHGGAAGVYLELVVDAQRSVNAKLLRLVNVATRAASTDSDIAIW